MDARMGQSGPDSRLDSRLDGSMLQQTGQSRNQSAPRQPVLPHTYVAAALQQVTRQWLAAALCIAVGSQL